MKNKKKMISVLLSALLLGSTLVSCGGTTDETTANTDVTAIETTVDTATETEPEKTFASFAAPDLGGATVRLGDTKQYDIYLFSQREELTGDVLNDAIYNSLRAVEEKLNITLTSQLFADPGQLANAVVAGDAACEIMTGQDLRMANLALEGYTLDISHMEQIDFTAPWWPTHSVSSYLINDQMLLFSNYMSYFGVSRARVWFINKQLAADYGVTIPYDDIFAGTWTLDKLSAMVKSVYQDTNGNGEIDEGDTVGYVNANGFICMQPSMGLNTFATGEDGKLTYVVDLDKFSGALEKMYNMLYNSGTVFQDTTGNKRLDQAVFQQGRSLLYYDSLGMAETVLRETDVEYGVLCNPKLDESQANYVAGYTDYSHAVPKTITDEGLVGWTIEALTASGYETIIPAFIDVCMSNKYVYDEETAKVIDLIGEKMHVEIAYSFSANMANMFHNLLNNKAPSTDIASYYESKKQLDLELMEQLNSLYGAN